MELLTLISELLPTIGFPILCVIGLGWFIYKIYSDTTKQNAANMEAVQTRCQEREEKLYQQLEKQNEINGKFAAIIAQYDVKLDHIQKDIDSIKTDVNIIMNK